MSIPQKSLAELLTKKLRPGDIYTHVYSGLRGELDPSGHANPALFEGRKRGVIFDVGHGGGSFTWRVAVPIVKEGFLPDSISTDLHAGSADRRHEGHAQRHEQVPGPGAVARRRDPPLDLEPGPRDQARATRATSRSGRRRTWPCSRLEKGDSASSTCYGARLRGTQKLTCEMTLRDGKIVYELNGLSRPDWTTLPKGYRATGDPRWDGNRGLQRCGRLRQTGAARIELTPREICHSRSCGVDSRDTETQECRMLRRADLESTTAGPHPSEANDGSAQNQASNVSERPGRPAWPAVCWLPTSAGRGSGAPAGARRDPGTGRPFLHQRGRHVHGPDRIADAARSRGGDAGRLAEIRAIWKTCTTPWASESPSCSAARRPW